MPVPIRSIPDQQIEKNYSIDYSFLLNGPSPKKTVTASNKDADLLFELWSKGEKVSAPNTVKISELSNFSKRDLTRLKTMGFISTSNDGIVEITKKGKTVITTMALGEVSTYEKNSEPKKYTEILASMDKRNKTGYRTPKFATNNNNNLRLS